MRQDAKYSTRKTVVCKKSSGVGFSTWKAKAGCWLVYAEGENVRMGRMLGVVDAEGTDGVPVKGMISVLVLADNGTHAYERWINPDEVREIYAHPPHDLLAWITGDELGEVIGSDPKKVVQMIEYGSTSDRYIEQRYTSEAGRVVRLARDLRDEGDKNPLFNLALANYDSVKFPNRARMEREIKLTLGGEA